MKITEWQGCYESSWKGVITPESFAHPAKYARGLIERIYDYMLERGMVERGQLVADCFGGIGTGGIIAAYRGLAWCGVELEAKFVGFAEANFKLHRSRWAGLQCPQPRMIQGDSRRFHELIAEASAVVSSPPFLATRGGASGGSLGKDTALGKRHYQAGLAGDREPNNIETLKAGSVDGIVSSPPYADTATTAGNVSNATKANWGKGKRLGSAAEGYGKTDGQIGQSTGETYWAACAAVYRSAYQALRPDGYMVLVTKDYVRAKKRVPLSDDTVRLMEHVGFELVERVRALLKSETRHGDLFTGENVETSSRKSFFRRVAEKKGSPPIDEEDVLFFRKPSA